MPTPREVVVGPPGHKGELLCFVREGEVCWRRPGGTRSGREHVIEDSQGKFQME